jgi:beta-lactamase regulating signal transducer with metallopeptidase domain
MFYLAYHFLVRKETFFDGNRWFLLAGLFTSALLPLFFIKRIIWVERPKISIEDLVAYSQQSPAITKEIQAVEAFDWMQLIWISYTLIALLLVIKIVLNLLSLHRMLRQQQVIKKERFKLINLNENIAPFSFFNYIVYNSDLYSNEELQSILLHEKIHSQERHSVDVMISKVFCIIFWFNPFIWLYKKAIAQNLEYIADQKAIQQLDDRQAYQKALLKVVSHQNCLSITNHFYQSLIKKRIVMLNTNQSHKRNSWKYAVILPALIGFVLLFQIKIVAQEIDLATWTKSISSKDDVSVKIDKNCSDVQLKQESAKLKDEHGVTLKFSKVKRNTSGEITCIKVSFKDKNGKKGTTQISGDEPIKPILFFKSGQSIGFGSPKQVRIYANGNHSGSGENFAYKFDDSIPEMRNLDIDIEAPEAPESPEAPEVSIFSEMPEMPERISFGDERTKIIVKKEGQKPLVILDGKVIEGDESIISEKELDELKNSTKMNDSGEETQIIINGKDLGKIRANALTNAQVQIKRMSPQIRTQVKSEMKRARADMERSKPEMERARMEMDAAKPEMERAKAEMQKAKEEMIQAKEEMLKAKAEFEKERANLKKPAKK